MSSTAITRKQPNFRRAVRDRRDYREAALLENAQALPEQGRGNRALADYHRGVANNWRSSAR
jgi:hypothetical protein